MSILDNMGSEKGIQEDSVDRVYGAGRKSVPSDIYEGKVKHAYLRVAKSEAIGVNVTIQLDNGAVVTDTQWVTSGKAKGCKNYFFERDRATGKTTDVKRYLPGHTMINDLVSLTTGFAFGKKTKTEKRTIKVWDYDAQAEVPTEVEMLVEVVGKPIAVAVLDAVRDRESLNSATGEYEPNGKVSKRNEISKYLHEKDHFTRLELVAKSDTATFAKDWLGTWQNKVDNTSSETLNGGVQGSPIPAGTQVKQSSIFED